MDYVKIEDHENNVCYNFTCTDWFSIESDDYKTMRILDVEEMTSVSTPGQKAKLDDGSDVSRPSSSSSSSSSISYESSLSARSKDKSVRSIKSTESSKDKKEKNLLAYQTETHSSPKYNDDEKDVKSGSRQSRSMMVGSNLSKPKRSESKSSVSSKTSKTSSSSSSSKSSSSSSSSADSSFIKPYMKNNIESEGSDSELKKNRKPKTPSRTKSERSLNQSTSSSVRQAEEDIQSRKFNFSPSPQPPTVNKELDFNVKVINTTKVKLSAVEAVELNQLETLKEIVKENSLEMMKKDKEDRTLMAIACEHGFDKIVRYIADNNDSLISVDTPLGNYSF